MKKIERFVPVCKNRMVWMMRKIHKINCQRTITRVRARQTQATSSN